MNPRSWRAVTFGGLTSRTVFLEDFGVRVSSAGGCKGRFVEARKEALGIVWRVCRQTSLDRRSQNLVCKGGNAAVAR